MKTNEKVEQGKGTADHLMPLGYLFPSISLEIYCPTPFTVRRQGGHGDPHDPPPPSRTPQTVHSMLFRLRKGLQSSKMSPSPPSTLRLTPDFFAALEKTKKIHSDCKMLLRSNQQKAGLEIMEQMALLEETAYERLYRSLQEEMRGWKICGRLVIL